MNQQHVTNRAPLLFNDEPNESQRYIRGLETEQAYSITPNAGQTWDIRFKNPDGTDRFERVQTVLVANNSPCATQPAVIVYRNKRKELHTCLLKDWIDEDTFYVGKTKELY